MAYDARCPDCGLLLSDDNNIVPLARGGFTCPDCYEEIDPIHP